MTAASSDPPRSLQLVPKLALLALVVAIIGLPINHLLAYALLVVCVIVVAVGRVTTRPRHWAAAVVIVMAALAGKLAVDVPRIEEGHNIFLPGGTDNALVSGLPPDVYRAMADEFDRTYPVAFRCDPRAPGCWQAGARPTRVYAFSFDGVYDTPAYSRRVAGIDFADAVWQRLGFINEAAYNWHSIRGDVGRGQRRRGLPGLLHPWRITMPHFVMFSLPAAFAGSQLCWRGTVLWEGAGERFTPLLQTEVACRMLAPDDAGKRIFGLAISPDAPLAMTLLPSPAIRLLQLYRPALALVAAAALLFLLLRCNPRRLVLPLTFVALSVFVMWANDASLLGGIRPLDGGNDGLLYDGWSRIMAQQFLAGDIVRALEGMEPVFYFTPGSRYLRMVEHFFTGETYLGYVSLLLLLPFLVFCLFKRYFTARTALAAALVFIAVPIGALFGSTFYIYVKHASLGFGDSAAAILFLAGILALIGHSQPPLGDRFGPAFGAGLLFAIAVFVRPNLAIGAAILLGGAGVAALWRRQAWRLAGMCIGFLPVFGMALHNWYFGGVFLLFGRQTTLAVAIPMPPYAYVSALWELLRFDFAGGNLAQGIKQIRLMLVGPSESVAMIPLHAAAFAIVVRVLLSRRYEGWLRLLAAAALGVYAPALFFVYSDRYQIVAWLLTALICFVWVRDEGWPWLDRRYPVLTGKILQNRALAWLLDGLDRFARAAGVMPASRTTSAG